MCRLTIPPCLFSEMAGCCVNKSSFLVHWNTIVLSTSEAASQTRPSGEPLLLNTAVVSGSTVIFRDMSAIITGTEGLMSTMVLSIIFDNTLVEAFVVSLFLRIFVSEGVVESI